MLRENFKSNAIELLINKDFSYEKMRYKQRKKNPTDILPKQRVMTSLSSEEHPCPLKIKLIPTSSNQSSQGFSFNFVRDQANGPRLQIKYIQPHIQLGDIKARFNIKLHSHSNCKIFWRSNQRSFIVFFHCKESYRGLYSHIYKSI